MTAGVDESAARRPPLLRLSPFQRIVIALVTGIGAGIFFGDLAAPLRTVGDVYVGLLQMTVLPFIVCSVIGNIGRMTMDQSRRLAIYSFAVLFALWGIGMAVLFVMAQALPDVPAGSFFSTSLLAPSREFDFLSIFVPSNPFRSLSENLVPGVVVFCIFVGLALIQSPSKGQILPVFDAMNDTLGRVANYVTRLSPIGVFAISASAAGTITLEEFGRLQAYFMIFIIASLLLTLVILPLIVAALTPFRYRDVLETQGNVLVTALAIGSVFAVIPLLVEAQKNLMSRLEERGHFGVDRDRLGHTAEFVIPLAYPFPHLGKIITLIFVPFAAWFYGQPMEPAEYPSLLVTGVFLSFGKVTLTIPFLLDVMEVPSDIFRLFLMSSVLAGPFSDLLGAAHLLTFTTILTCALSGMLQLRRLKLIGVAALCFVICVGAALSTRQVLAQVFSELFEGQNVIATMDLMEDRVPFEILAVSEPNPDSLLPGETAIDRILRRGRMRVGFDPDHLPFSYYNGSGELVGHDIDLMHRLAYDNQLELEFVPYNTLTLSEQLSEDHFDFAISGLEVNLREFPNASYGLPYMTLNMAFVTRDHERAGYESLAALEDGEGLTLGVHHGAYFGKHVAQELPKARIVNLWSESQFFEGPPEHMDALVTSAQGGSAWTLIHPDYAVVNPRDGNASAPVAFVVPQGDSQMDHAIDTWVRLKRHDGTLDRLYEYWILGLGVESAEPRWSVLRNVLHWVD